MSATHFGTGAVVVDYEGVCRAVHVALPNGKRITPEMFNELRTKLGMVPLTADEIAAYNVPDWNPVSVEEPTA